jgi:hypothetical protein
MTNETAEMSLADGLLGFLEKLSAQLLVYSRSPVPAYRVDELRSLCWDMETLFVANTSKAAKVGRAAAEEWILCAQNYERASEQASETVKAVGWLWARGTADKHPDTIAEAMTALEEAARGLLRSTIGLATVGERIASDASAEAARMRPDLVQRFASARAGCARAGVGLRSGYGGLGPSAAGGEC